VGAFVCEQLGGCVLVERRERGGECPQIVGGHRQKVRRDRVLAHRAVSELGIVRCPDVDASGEDVGVGEDARHRESRRRYAHDAVTFAPVAELHDRDHMVPLGGERSGVADARERPHA